MAKACGIALLLRAGAGLCSALRTPHCTVTRGAAQQHEVDAVAQQRSESQSTHVRLEPMAGFEPATC